MNAGAVLCASLCVLFFISDVLRQFYLIVEHDECVLRRQCDERWTKDKHFACSEEKRTVITNWV